MRVQGRVVVVTGAGNGIGRELVLNLLSKGARVAGIDLNANSLAETERLAEATTSNFQTITADISDREAVDRLPELIQTRFGVIDAVINNAGIIQPFLRLTDLDYATIHRVLNVNLFGTLYVLKAFVPHLIARQEAHIVNLSSMGGFVPVPGQTVYCAAKAAVKLMSEGLASELLGTNVRVTTVFPGAIATNITANSGVQRQPEPDGKRATISPLPASEAAEIIVNAMESNAYQVCVGRDSKIINLLSRMNPAYAARTIAKRMSGMLPLATGVR